MITEELSDSEKKNFLAEYEFEFKKGQAMYYSKLSLERPLTDQELKRFRQLCNEIGIKL